MSILLGCRATELDATYRPEALVNAYKLGKELKKKTYHLFFFSAPVEGFGHCQRFFPLGSKKEVEVNLVVIIFS